MARQSLILTVIADDRPGLVGELSAAISAHKGNWLESSLAQHQFPYPPPLSRLSWCLSLYPLSSMGVMMRRGCVLERDEWLVVHPRDVSIF